MLRGISEYLDKIHVKQRDENINAILEDREPKNIPISASSRGYLNDDNEYQIKSFNIVDGTFNVDVEIIPKRSLEYINTDITIKSSKDY
jgi:hypothetical protein